MPSLKALRIRINSVRSTRKITSAMKMVAASKLRRAQFAAESARPYADRMERMLGALATSMAGQPGAHPMLSGTGKSDVHLILVASADRGLCGGFNSSIVRVTRRARVGGVFADSIQRIQMRRASWLRSFHNAVASREALNALRRSEGTTGSGSGPKIASFTVSPASTPAP